MLTITVKFRGGSLGSDEPPTGRVDSLSRIVYILNCVNKRLAHTIYIHNGTRLAHQNAPDML